MIVKVGNKSYDLVEIKEFVRGGKKYQANCIRIYARYHLSRNLYSNNYITIPYSKREFDLFKEVENFKFTHNFKNTEDEIKFSNILGYQLYNADINTQKQTACTPTEPINIFWISDKIETVKNKSNNTDLEKNKDFYIPTKEDCEMAYTKPGEKIHVNKLLDKLHEELTKQGKVLDPKWRIITKKNIEKWSRSS